MGGLPTLNYGGIDSAIAGFENSNPAYNNPGSIMYGKFAVSNGAVGQAANGLAIFPSATQGTVAEDNLVTSYANQGYSINELINAWAPASAAGNSSLSTSNYQNFVAQQTGLDPTTPINQQIAPAASTSSTSNNSFWCSLIPLFGPVGNFMNLSGQCPGMNGSNSGVSSSFLSQFGLSWGRVGSFLLGLILIAAGLYMFKPVQNITVGAIRKGTKGAVGAAFTV